MVLQLSGGWLHNYSTKTREGGIANEMSAYNWLSISLTERDKNWASADLFKKTGLETKASFWQFIDINLSQNNWEGFELDIKKGKN